MKARKCLIMAKSAALVCCVLLWQTASASAWFQDRIVQDRNADVSITIMRWGVPDDDLGNTSDKKFDRIVGQVASDKYKTVTLIFESSAIGKKVFRLTVTTGVHVYDEGRSSFCTLCLGGRRDGYGRGTNSKGAQTSGGCYLEMLFPRNQSLRKLRLIDVQSQGESVYYFVKFNVTPDLIRGPLKVPVSKTATLHPAGFNFEVRDTPAAEKAHAVEDARAPDPAEAPAIDAESGFEHAERKAFEELSQNIAAKYEADMQKLRAGYSDALNALEKRVQASADLKGSVAVKTEKERFALTNSVEQSALSGYSAVKGLQSQFLNQSGMLERQKSAEVGALAQSYLLRLKTIQDDYTKAGKIEDALLARAESAKIKADLDGLYPHRPVLKSVKAEPLIIDRLRYSGAGFIDAVQENSFYQHLLPKGENSRVINGNIRYYTKIQDKNGAVREHVILGHPPKSATHASLDLAEATKETNGTLVMSTLNMPGGDCVAVIKVDGKEIKRIDVTGDVWIEHEIPFNRKSVVVEIHPTGWQREFLFASFVIK
jgi:hypothetical protein